MRLADLEPCFLRYEEREDGVFFPWAANLGLAMGVHFLCPKCVSANGHAIIVWFAGRGVPDDAEPGAAYLKGESEDYPEGRPAQRWTVSGSSWGDLTLAPSIRLKGGCAWHGWVQNGQTKDA